MIHREYDCKCGRGLIGCCSLIEKPEPPTKPMTRAEAEKLFASMPDFDEGALAVPTSPDDAQLWALTKALAAANARAEAAERERDRQSEHNKLQQATLHELHARMKDKDARVQALEAERDAAYKGRNYCVALAAKLAVRLPFTFRAYRMTDASQPDEWSNVIAIRTPVGQMTWHVHAREMAAFNWLDLRENDWDGHTAEQKHERIEQLEPLDAINGGKTNG
jgi:hypothetical protein